MKLNTKYKIEKAVATDCTRYMINFVHISDDKKFLIATDGRMLAKVPVEIEKKDDIGNQAIPGEVLKDARKKARRSSMLTLGMNGSFQHTDGVSVPRPLDVGQYPNWETIFPRKPEIKNRITLNPRKLLALAEALGDGDSVTLEFQSEPTAAIIAKNKEAIGLLMPIQWVQS